MIDKYISQFKYYLAKYVPQLGAQSTIPSEMIQPVPQINKQLVLEIMIQEYTKKILDTLKNTLENEYKKAQTAESKLAIHSKEHIALVQKMHDISINLIKVSDAHNNLTMYSSTTLETLYKELNLKPYK